MVESNTAAWPPAADAPPRQPGRLGRARRAAGRWLREHRPELILIALVTAVAVVLLLPTIVYTIPAGHVGVLWKRFSGGTVTDFTYGEGLRLILPWNRLYIYDVRLQQVSREVKVLSSDGLHITMDLAWRFRVQPGAAGKLHKFVGPEYQEILIAPTISARARDVVAIYDPSEIYTENRLAIQKEIGEAVRYDLKKRFNPEGEGELEWFVFEDILIKGIALPPGVQEAIVRKNAAYHEMQMYSFVIQKEQKEAERKRIEAVGIRNFQEIVSNGMTESYLRWRGIEATLDLAKSPNAKVVVIGGGGKNGLPLILNADGARDAAAETAALKSASPSAADAAAKVAATLANRPSADTSPPEPAAGPEPAGPPPKRAAVRELTPPDPEDAPPWWNDLEAALKGPGKAAGKGAGQQPPPRQTR